MIRRQKCSVLEAAGAAAVILAATAAAWGRQHAPDWRALRYPELRAVRRPEIQRTVLSNGMRVFAMEDRELPLVQVIMRMDVGTMHDPPDRIGLAAITSQVLQTGGTSSRTGEQIDRELDRMAADLEMGVGVDFGHASLCVLREDAGTALATLEDILTRPAFPEDKLRLAKARLHSAVARRDDSPEDLAMREFKKLIYGADSVYARQAEHAMIDAIDRHDVVAFHRDHYCPNRTVLAIGGDLDTQEMFDAVAQTFQEWTPVEGRRRDLPSVEYEYRSTVNLVRKADISQSTILVGHLGGTMSGADHAALTVLNRILGDSFTGRLFQNIRCRQGLAYTVGGGFLEEYAYPGILCIGCQTSSANTIRAVHALKEELHRMVMEQVAEEELTTAKESYLNSFVFNCDTTREILERELVHAYYGYPANFLETTRRNVERVTSADVLRAAGRHVPPPGSPHSGTRRPRPLR